MRPAHTCACAHVRVRTRLPGSPRLYENKGRHKGMPRFPFPDLTGLGDLSGLGYLSGLVQILGHQGSQDFHICLPAMGHGEPLRAVEPA
jgi:hypothetical protein